MNVLFVEIDTESQWSVASLGPAFLAAVLRQAGHRVAFVRIGVDDGVDSLVQAVEAAQAGLVGASLTTRQWLRCRDLMAQLRRRCSVPVIVGGLHPTFAAAEVLRHDGIDYACLGEGETALLELVGLLESGADRQPLLEGRIANIQAKGGVRPALRAPIEPVDAIPFAARDLLDERWGTVHLSTQRGCPFPCTYCAARMYDALYADIPGGAAYGRRRSHGNVLAELRALRESGPLNYVIFLDDTFTIHHPWVREFCRVYRAEFGVPFSLHARVETVDQRLLGELAAAGCRQITYGVESGSERVRREIMKRSASDQRFIDVFGWTREAGILVTANYILGTPGETLAEMEQTIALHERLQPGEFAYFVFYPYPGTALFQLCRERGYLPHDYLERPALHRRSVLNLPDVTAEQIDAVYARWTALRAQAMVGRMPVDAPAESVDAAMRIAALHAAAG